MNPALIGLLINGALMIFSLNIAFNKRFRPITWTSFYCNLGAAAVNLVACTVHIWKWIFT